jgi:hypothetical protein
MLRNITAALAARATFKFFAFILVFVTGTAYLAGIGRADESPELWLALSTAKLNAQLDRESKVSMTYLASSSQIIRPIPIGVDKELTLSTIKLFTSNDAGKVFFTI